jgi:glucose/arabinose dehydrogenase
MERVFDFASLASPVFLTHAGDRSGRIFIVEQRGVIKVIDPESRTVRTFLDHSNIVNSGPGEAGLLGLAFHPDYADNGRVFLSYTWGNLVSRVAEMSVSADPDSLDASAERLLLQVDQPAGNHNGGQIDFGPDGMLYVGFGDGGASNDRFGNGQNPTTLLATILRLDVDRQEDGLEYGIPPDNPLAGNGDGWRQEIWAWGLRNPWRFSFDRVTGDLWAGDVGQGRQEEIDLIRRGGNYGWNVQEGFECFQATTCDESGLEPPVLQYGRSDGVSVTGGYVYRGQRLGDLYGAYVYADFGSGHIWAIRHDGTAITESARIVTAAASVSSFGEDEAGELYVVGYGGSIYRFLPLPDEEPVVTAVAGVMQTSPRGFELDQNYPNPFNPSTMIRYSLGTGAVVDLTVYDILGRRVRTLASGLQTAGSRRVIWNGEDRAGRRSAPGVYLYRLSTDGVVRETRHMVLVK